MLGCTITTSSLGMPVKLGSSRLFLVLHFVKVCEYENVCADLPSPALGVGQGYASQTDGIYFVGSDIVPSYARSRAGHWPRDREAVAAEAPTECRHVAAAAGRGESWVDNETQAGLPSPRCLRWLRHFLRLYPRPGTSVPWRVDTPDDQGFDCESVAQRCIALVSDATVCLQPCSRTSPRASLMTTRVSYPLGEWNVQHSTRNVLVTLCPHVNYAALCLLQR